jgi:hypothetical protein
VSETLLSHYADHLPSLEQRYMVALPVLRIEGCRMISLTCRHPGNEVLDLYKALPPSRNAGGSRRPLPCSGRRRPVSRPIAAKVLDRPDLLDEITQWIGDEPAFIEPWSVGGYERDLAVALDVPVYGPSPDLWPLGFKSAGRHLMRRAGVNIPIGIEDLHTIGEGVEAIERIRAARPDVPAVVVKHDDSGAGDGKR